jgi:hypothetical protein
MIANPLEKAIYKVINDRRIFTIYPELINKSDWMKLKEAWSKADNNTALQIIEQAKLNLTDKIRLEKDFRKRDELQKAQNLISGFKTKIETAPTNINRLLEQLDCFGPIRCNLPNMEDFGKIIESHGYPTVEHFFLYKIHKERDNQRNQALTALFEVVKELYERRVEPLEIAFFVRKIDSLIQFMEVLK